MSKFIISESEKQRILEMHQNATSRQYLMETTNDTTLVVTAQPAPINRTVCDKTDYFKVECQIKNTGTEIAYLSRGAFGGAGLTSEGNFKTTFNGKSQFSDHDNSGVIMPIVPVGKTVFLTMVVNTDLKNWQNRVNTISNKIRAERNPAVREALQTEYKAALAKPKFGNNLIYLEYNGGKLQIPVTVNITVDPKNNCDAPIDIAKGF
jgi:hypothetical protein